MDNRITYQREITALSSQDSFLVMNRVRDRFDYPIHFHPEMELNFIANGKGMQRTVGFSTEVIDDYELVLVGSNVYHGWEMFECNHSVHEVTIQFHKDLFSESLLRRSLMKSLKDMFDRSIHGILFNKSAVKKIAPRIIGVSELDGIDYFMELFSILYDLSQTNNQKLLSAAQNKPDDFENSDKIKRLYNYIKENYSKKITLDEVANLLNMTKVSFNRLMKKTTGLTFIEYLNDVRIDNASRLLAGEDYTISEVAFMCGFNNIANFNRTFKRIKGITPSVYRKRFFSIKYVQ